MRTGRRIHLLFGERQWAEGKKAHFNPDVSVYHVWKQEQFCGMHAPDGMTYSVQRGVFLTDELKDALQAVQAILLETFETKKPAACRLVGDLDRLRSAELGEYVYIKRAALTVLRYFDELLT